MPARLVKAKLQEITWDSNGQPQNVGSPFDVQFNPQSLEVVFDVTVLEDDKTPPAVTDVRNFSDKVKYFMKPVPKGFRGSGAKREALFMPPGVSFVWGQFTFNGV